MNAWKHGLAADTIVISDEDPEQFLDLCAALEDEFMPKSRLARELVHRLATLLWRLRRIPVLEAAIFDALRGERKMSAEEEATRKRQLGEDLRRLLPNLPPPEVAAKIIAEAEEGVAPPPPPPPDEQTHDDRRITGLALIKDGQHHDTLGKLSRYEASLMAGLGNTLQILHVVQKLGADEDQLDRGRALSAE
jgi:hypothetical protein